jgi:hypothetical protein
LGGTNWLNVEQRMLHDHRRKLGAVVGVTDV